MTLNAARADDTDWKANRPVQVTAVAREHAHALHTHSEQTRACTAGWPRAGARGRSKCGVRVQQRTSVSDVAGAVQLGPGDDGRGLEVGAVGLDAVVTICVSRARPTRRPRRPLVPGDAEAARDEV